MQQRRQQQHLGLGLESADEQRRVPVDIRFADVTYTSWHFSVGECARVPKRILHGVSGEFKGGQLSVIMGPSGAGKSTLLNVLAGYVSSGAGGTVSVGGRTRQCAAGGAPHPAAYIQQDDELRPRLTVRESMTLAAHLKLGYGKHGTDAKKRRVERVLELLGLETHGDTMTGRLSGGQRRRLAVALELISNPPVLYLDEPTTGLDGASCGQCVSLLKRLAADEGRTVVCTMHQPSALLFEMFDRLYAVADGRCIYQGPVKELLPFLGGFGLRCPPYHNPADFLIEVSSGERGADVLRLAEATSGLLTVKNDFRPTGDGAEKDAGSDIETALSALTTGEKRSGEGAGQPMQFLVLLARNALALRRGWRQVAVRVATHVLLALLFGYLYAGVGAAADTVLANYVYLYGSMLLNVYTGKMSVVLGFPLEMAVLSREHFNRWYRLAPYVLATLCVEVPLQAACTWLYVAVSYRLTEQPVDEPWRYQCFLAFCVLGALCAQSWGYFVGATTPVKLAVFVGPVVAVLFSVFGFCITLRDTPVYFRWLYHASYYRAGFHGVVTSVYGLGRADLSCPEEELYCHYAAPVKFLKEMDITDVDLSLNASLIVTIAVLMHLLTFGALWLRLNKR